MIRRGSLTILPAVAALLMLSACTTPSSPAATAIECDGGSGLLTVTPGLTSTPSPNTYTVANTSSLGTCVDKAGLGITGGTLRDVSLEFPSLDCTGSGDNGNGVGTIDWSDGSSSAISVAVVLDPVVKLEVKVVSGTFAGSTGATEFTLLDTFGDCSRGIVAEEFALGPLALVGT